jgi:hypothetical protein
VLRVVWSSLRSGILSLLECCFFRRSFGEHYTYTMYGLQEISACCRISFVMSIRSIVGSPLVVLLAALVAAPAIASLCPMTVDCPMRAAEVPDTCAGGAHGGDTMEHEPPASQPQAPAYEECCSMHAAPERSPAKVGESLRAPDRLALSAPASVPAAALASQLPEGSRPPWPPRPPLLRTAGSLTLCILLGTFLN